MIYPTSLFDLEIDWKAETLRPSAWLQHVPFAFWIIKALEPRCFVELGTHTGTSYFAFCQAVDRLNLSSKCFAVDTWLGDEHAGKYEEEIFENVSATNDQKYKSFSYLLRTTFDDASKYFAEGEVDLLHIDGFHTYEAVSHDFLTWESKLSQRAVVIFHDINVRERGFGVWKFWDELSKKYPSFSFDHGHGLGILGYGCELQEGIKQLLVIADDEKKSRHVRALFSARGEAVLNLFRLNEVATQKHQLDVMLEKSKNEVAAQKLQLEVMLGKSKDETQLKDLEAALVKNTEVNACLSSEIATLSAEKIFLSKLLSRNFDNERENLSIISQLRYSLNIAKLEIAKRTSEIQALNIVVDKNNKLVQELSAKTHELWNSTSWRITGPIRAIKTYFRRNKKINEAGFDLSALDESALSLLAIPAASNVSAVPEISVPYKNKGDSLTPNKLLNAIWIGGEPDTPGYRYRVLYWAEAARFSNASVLHYRLDEIDDHYDEIGRAHVVVLWRAAWDDRVARIVEVVRRNGGRLIFDIDDLMFDARLAKIEFIDGIRSQSLSESMVSEHYSRVHRTMMAADLCIASTEELAMHFRVFGKPALVMPNGFNLTTFNISRMAVRRRRAKQPDGHVRLGYAGGSRTHQRDFAICAPAVARVLRENPMCKLVLFRDTHGTPLIDVSEYPMFAEILSQIEWREMVPLVELPNELARLDINLAPLETNNLFCEAKSELKYFEAALVEVCTVASPTGPYARAIENDVTGYLAADNDSWYNVLSRLVLSPDTRKRITKEAMLDVLWRFGPDHRSDLAASLLEQALRGRTAARAFALHLFQKQKTRKIPDIPESTVVFEHDRLAKSDVTIVIPLYNYENYILEALESVAGQSLMHLDLVIVDDASTDASLARALEWAKQNKDRFNRLIIKQNEKNSKLGPTRNVGFYTAETPYVLPLDADNLLRPKCAEQCLDLVNTSGAAYVYPKIQAFGTTSRVMGDTPYDPMRFIAGNYIDAMALISKGVWAGVGGYENVPHGWEDYQFWCKVAEFGLFGVTAGDEILAEYRIHPTSMLSETNALENHGRVEGYLYERHPWLKITRTDPVDKFLKEQSFIHSEKR